MRAVACNKRGSMLKFTKVEAWVSEPPGVEVIADKDSVVVKANGQPLFGMATEPGPEVLLMPDALVTAVGPDGQPHEKRISGQQAKVTAESFGLQTSEGSVHIGKVLGEAWQAHQRMSREARSTQGLVG